MCQRVAGGGALPHAGGYTRTRPRTWPHHRSSAVSIDAGGGIRPHELRPRAGMTRAPFGSEAVRARQLAHHDQSGRPPVSLPWNFEVPW